MFAYAIFSIVLGIILGSYAMYKEKDYIIGICAMGGFMLAFYMIGIAIYAIAISL